jgi:asparagine synthase (glutamine-hydrolysing)
MCGIAGIVVSEAERYRATLERMTEALAHRGPDASGVHVSASCVLGHRRLSIVDLEASSQPMCSAVSGARITFNGEIYGYREIRRTLADYPFRTSGDTEVILALYDRYGTDMMSRLPGMFAFAIWDDARQELFAARDRFGEKPFYYTLTQDGIFLFASEIKAITATDLFSPKLKREALVHYFRYLYVHPAHCIYDNIFTLPPAHYLRFKPGGSIHVERYWEVPIARDGYDLRDAAERLEELMSKVVARQLVADVPVGAFLSGGLDSSTVVAVAAKQTDRLKTFSFAFKDAPIDLPYAREVAAQYGTEHFELSDGDCDVASLLVQMQEVYDEPFADSSNIPTFLISKLARQHLKVILTGDGADELLGGYTFWYNLLTYYHQRYRKWPWLVYLLRALNRLVYLSGSSAAHRWYYRTQGAVMSTRFESLLDAHLDQRRLYKDAELRLLGLDPLPEPPEKLKMIKELKGDCLDHALRLDLQEYMPGDILTKVDRASMAHGLELRAPFLDMELASFLLTLPCALKITRAEDKRVLRAAFGKAWPASLRTRGKCGFVTSVRDWLRRPSFLQLKAAHLDNPGHKLFDLISFEGSRSVAARNDYHTWVLLVLALWLERHPVELN